MKRFILALIIMVSGPSWLIAQKNNFGLAIGSTLFFGDLGGANYIGRPLFFDLERSLIKPVGTAFFHHQYSKRIAFRVQGSLTGIAGDDKLITPAEIFAPEWFRWYRNLNFHSSLWEISGQVELYLSKYYPGSLSDRVGPYLAGGVGVFHFNPKADYNGTEVELRPLRTEGQGFPGSDVKEYSLFQPCLLIGAGIRYNVTHDFTIGFEYVDRKTFTDYLDDVSGVYVSQSEFDNYFASDPLTGALAYDLSVRSDEIDPDGVYASTTAPGAQRGDIKDKDHFIYAQFYFAWVMNKKSVSKKSQLKCMKWGGEGGSNPNNKSKYHR